jgi:predicted ATPase
MQNARREMSLESRSQPRVIGRDAELRSLMALVDQGERLITITGAPGVGKTILARRLLADVPNGAFVDLRAARDELELCAAVARALGATLTGGSEAGGPAFELGILLGSLESTLLVLDNFEQLRARAELTLGDWLARAAGVQIVITSRERLDLPEHETVFELGALKVPAEAHFERTAAVELFVDRAARARPGYLLLEEEEAAVAEIVRQLDGNPLAIVLAASRLSVLSASDVLAKLTDRFKVLRHSGASPGRSTLESAIEWSWNMLSDAERAVLADCSAFRGGFTLRALESNIDTAELPDAPWIVDVAGALRSKSLIEVSQPGSVATELRFSLLESIREYAKRALPERYVEARTRHAAFYATEYRHLLQVRIESLSAVALEQVMSDRENLIAAFETLAEEALAVPDEAARAVEMALILVPVLALSGPAQREQAILERALPLANDLGSLSESLRLALWLSYASASASFRNREFEQLLSKAGAIEPSPIVARALHVLGRTFLNEGESERAKQCFDRLERLALGFPAEEACALYARALLAASQGEHQSAIPLFSEAIELAERAGERWLLAPIHIVLGFTRLEGSELAAGTTHLELAISIARSLGNRRLLAYASGSIAMLDLEAGELDSARRVVERVVDELRVMGDRRGQAAFSLVRAALHATFGDEQRARSELERAKALGAWPDLVRTRYTLEGLLDIEAAHAARKAGDVDREQRLHENAKARLADAGDGSAARLERASFDVRWARRLLERALTEERPVSTTSPRVELLVEAECRWFRLHDHDQVSLERRGPARRILQRLVQARTQTPGRPVEMEELIRAGWPEEKMRALAGINRVHVALTSLRNVGLRRVLISRERGHLLDPNLQLVVDRTSRTHP